MPHLRTNKATSSSTTHAELFLRRRHTPDVSATYAVDAVALKREPPTERP
jgi:hypothetical protein